jgi:HEPN domain-containing protein
MRDRAKVMYDNAINNLDKAQRNLTTDDAFFDVACFNAQQAVEFMIKAVLLEYAIPFESSGNQGHDILYLSDLVLDSTPFRFEKQADLTKLASTITEWETRGRYFSGIRTKEQTVRRVLNIYKDMEQSFSKIKK